MDRPVWGDLLAGGGADDRADGRGVGGCWAAASLDLTVRASARHGAGEGPEGGTALSGPCFGPCAPLRWRRSQRTAPPDRVISLSAACRDGQDRQPGAYGDRLGQPGCRAVT